jgi:4-aminobutyrate aminotransferase-like enzyme/Ser/Thr protein kinase RdoA (MazF antagonist)
LIEIASFKWINKVIKVIDMQLDYSKIQISKLEAASILKELYQIQGEINELPGELDFNFRIQTEEQDYVLKVSRPNADLDELDLQVKILKHLSEYKDLNSPTLIKDIQGNSLSEIIDENNQKRKVRLLTFQKGRLWSNVNPILSPLIYQLGQEAGKITSSLQTFDHPKLHRTFEWDIAQVQWIENHFDLFNTEQKQLINHFYSKFLKISTPYNKLRKSTVHNDVNDNNIVVSSCLENPKIEAIIDYGDAVHTQTINDLAIALAYSMMDKNDPLDAAIPVVKGYHHSFKLQEEELELLFTLIPMRLLITVTKSAINKEKEPDNIYLQVSEKPAWDLLYKWSNVNPDFALASFRVACGYSAVKHENKFHDWVKKQSFTIHSLFPAFAGTEIYPIDLSVSSSFYGRPTEANNLAYFKYKTNELQAQHPSKLLAGGYLEARNFYTTEAYDKEGNSGPESRTIHLGIDYWLNAETPVHCFYEGEVVTACFQEEDKSYGGLIILKHSVEDFEFYTLYGHLSRASIENLAIGSILQKGELIGKLGQQNDNGNWVPHLHFQLMLSKLDLENDFPGVCYVNQMDVWKSICPNPSLLFQEKKLENQEEIELLSYRKKHLGKSLSLSYSTPLKIVRGEGVYLIDDQGRKYLDTVNNVAHVGHEHPKVVQAGQNQMACLNTNTRYLHPNINAFAKELLETFPEELSVVHFVNSGSEANELAMRMAKAVTNQKDIIALEVGYHGNTGACIDISSYKFEGKGGKGIPEYTHIVPLPDSFRGIYQGDNTGEQYASHIPIQIENIQQKGRNVAAFIAEPIVSCGGQIDLPNGYLKLAYQSIREAGGVCISDEVQVGCGRVGSHFWGFQLYDVIPDIVTIGKPLGNGHPLAAVVCTPAVAEAFANGMEYFNTFGGNPVSCAIGTEVLRVVKSEKLQENALEVGNYLKEGLRDLQTEHPIIGDVRGQGLFLGFELVDEEKNPLTQKTAYLANRMKDYGILMSVDGRDNNVLKIKPPIIFSIQNADRLLETLKLVLNEDYIKY